jgi:hypothetical protein
MKVSAAIPSCAGDDIERRPLFSQFLKKARRSAPLIFHWALWSALGVALISSGIRQISHHVRAGRLRPVDPLHSINRCLWGLNGPDHSAQLLQTLTGLPQDRTVVIFMGEDYDGQLGGVVMSYLAWPHPVEMFFKNDNTAEKKLSAIRPDSLAVVAFCNTDPPAWFSAGSVGAPGVRIIRLTVAGSRL